MSEIPPDEHRSGYAPSDGVDVPFGNVTPEVTGLVPTAESALDRPPLTESAAETADVPHEQARGSWKVHDESSDPHQVYDDLLDFNMDWFARPGDFHIYSQQHAETESAVPLLAIWIADGLVQEVCGRHGVSGSELRDIPADVIAHIEQLPGGEQQVRNIKDAVLKESVSRKLAISLEAYLTDDEIHFLYEIDPEPDASLEPVNLWFQEQRYQRHEMDRPSLIHLYEQRVNEQFAPAYRAYAQIGSILERIPGCEFNGPQSEATLRELLEAQQQQWRDAGIYEHITNQRYEVTEGLAYDLVITPRAQVTHAGILRLVNDFAERTEGDLFVDDRLANESFLHTDIRQRDASPTDAPVLFSLVARYHDTVRDTIRPYKQLQLLEDLQTTYPTVGYHVPSVLEAICRWYTLDEQQIPQRYEEYVVIHFDAKQPAIPYSAVVDGVPQIGFTRSSRAAHTTRLALG